MFQFLSKCFLDFFNFCWVFQKFPFFCVTLYNLDFQHFLSEPLAVYPYFNVQTGK